MIIQAKGITKSFGALQVLKGIDFSAEPGEIASIMGASFRFNRFEVSQLHIRTTSRKAPMRVIVEFSLGKRCFDAAACLEEELVLTHDGASTPEYAALTADFFL